VYLVKAYKRAACKELARAVDRLRDSVHAVKDLVSATDEETPWVDILVVMAQLPNRSLA
jgi:hypothetical protein